MQRADTTSNSSLKEYIDSMNDPIVPGTVHKQKDARLNRPFDAPTYDKTNPPFGVRAIALTTDALDIINLDQIDETLIERIQQDFNELLEDINDIQGIKLPSGKENAIKSGYIFNAFNRHVIAPALSTASQEKVAIIKQQSEILRLISDNLEKSPQEILAKVKKSNRDKIANLCISAVAAGVGEGKDIDEKFNTQDNKIRMALGQKLGNIDDEKTLKARMYDYIELGPTLLARAFGPSKPGKPSPAEKFPGVNMTLVEAWARCSNQIQQDINANTGQLALYTSMQSAFARDSGLSKFGPVADFVHDILSIQLNYEARWAGLKERFTNKEKDSYKFKYDVIKAVNHKLEDLLVEFPDKKNIEQIRDEMMEYLMEQREVLRTHEDPAVRKSELASHLDRTISKFKSIQTPRKNKMDNIKKNMGKASKESLKEAVNDKVDKIKRRLMG